MDFQVLGHVAVPRLYRRHFYSSLYPHGLKSPRLFAFGFASCQTLFLCSVMLNLFQHLTASLFLHFLRGQILKRVQDDGGKCWLLAIRRLQRREVK